MLYGSYRDAGYFIGSGVIEAGCKNVVGQRVKQSGMLWSLRGADNVLSVRCAVMNGVFDGFWQQGELFARLEKGSLTGITASTSVTFLSCTPNCRVRTPAAPRMKSGRTARAVAIPGAHGITLGAWYCPRPPSNPLVILFHGYAGDKTSMVAEAKSFS